jgi:hypothetical protein
MNDREARLREFLWDMQVELQSWKGQVEREPETMSRNLLIEQYDELLAEADDLVKAFS